MLRMYTGSYRLPSLDEYTVTDITPKVFVKEKMHWTDWQISSIHRVDYDVITSPDYDGNANVTKKGVVKVNAKEPEQYDIYHEAYDFIWS